MKERFDEKTGLAWRQLDGLGNQADWASSFSTAWLLMPLLQSDQPGDRELVTRALEALVEHQYDYPDLPHHGSWPDAPTKEPLEHSLHWLTFDPNFREFIGVPFVCALQDFEDELPDELVQGMDQCLIRAVEGGMARELTPDYSNIALLHAYFVAAVGERFGRQDWLSYGVDLAERVYSLFKRHNCFDEFNSPTYSTLDLDALALWIERPPAPVFAEYGRDMEYYLWLEIGEFYHAGLENVCGPYDRAYFLDLRENHGPFSLGSYINAVLPSEDKPFLVPPAPESQVQRIPAQTRRHFEAFQGERQIERTITDTPQRVATAWLSEYVMIGAQDTSKTKLIWAQYHMATMHWRLPDGDVGCLRLVPTMSTDARAESGRLSTWTYVWPGSGTTDINFKWELHCPGLTPEMIEDDIWQLPGLDLLVKTNTRNRRVSTTENGLAVEFTGNNRDAGTCLCFEIRCG